MDVTAFIGLVQNAALLLALALVHDVLDSSRQKSGSVVQHLSVGLILGVLGIAIMMTPWEFSRGIVFDTRSVLLGVSGLFFGGVTALVSMASTAAFRVYMGGAGTLTGVSVILASGLIGLAWHRLRVKSLVEASWRELYLFGIAVHAAMLALMFTLPWKSAVRVLEHITVPVLVIYPIGTALLGMLMVNRLKHARTTSALKESEERTRLAIAAGNLGLYDIDLRTGANVVNAEYALQLGYDPEEFHESASSWSNRLHPDDREAVDRLFQSYIKGETDRYRAEYRLRTASGGWIRVLSLGEIVERDSNGSPTRMLGTHTDITQTWKTEEALRLAQSELQRSLEEANQSRRDLLDVIGAQAQTEKSLQSSVKEQEVLLRELYHRTKNNMQMIRSMLSLQSADMESEEVKHLVRETNSKIDAIALIHQMLYQSQHLSRIDLQAYVQDLAYLAISSYRAESDRITLKLEMDAVSANIEVATPIGLIMNELLSNTVKHAFPDGRSGEIRVGLSKLEGDVVRLEYSDDGTGPCPGFDPRKQKTYGLISVFGIAERQLGGRVAVDSSRGLSYSIRFPGKLFN